MPIRTLIVLGVIIIMLNIGAGCAKIGEEKNNYNSASSSVSITTSTDNNGNLAVLAVIEPGVEIIKKDSKSITTSTENYMKALSIYGKNGYRFQFANCSGYPNSINMKKGTKFMIDNRDNESHKIGIGVNTYQLKAYDFAVVTVQKIGSYIITCDGGGSTYVGVEN